MSGTDVAPDCRQLLARLDAARDDEERARLVAEHLTTCPTCVAAEAALASLLAQYGSGEAAPLDAARERRLLDFLCDRQAPG